ncbi:MAG: hypothetical protein Q8L47_02615 [bacterium]|nr:hypothetical protein [bacterium]
METLNEKNQFADYKQKLEKRKVDLRTHTKHQSIGLLIAELLDDFAHKALYIKLAKEKDTDNLLRVAKDVSQMKNINNKGGYFMRVLYSNKMKNEKLDVPCATVANFDEVASATKAEESYGDTQSE